jgi:hypothetical protein
MIDGQKRSFLQFQDVRAFLDSVLDEDIHTKRVDSLANTTLGVMTGASLAQGSPHLLLCYAWQTLWHEAGTYLAHLRPRKTA